MAEVANAITASLANGALGHNEDENVIAFDAYNQVETGSVSKTVASRVDQDTASCIAFDTTQITSPHNYSNPQPGGPCHPLAAGAHPPAVAFNRQCGATQNISVADNFSPSLIKSQTRDEVRLFGNDGQTVGVLAAEPGMKQTSYVAQPFSIMPMNSGKDYKARATDVAQPLMAGGPVGGNQGGDFIVETLAVAFQSSQSGIRVGPAHATLDANNGARRHNGVLFNSAVRRLTPVECERLQGFPDNFTAIPWRKKPADECPDGPRYKAIGNSMAVPVMRWIGERIQLVDDFVSLF